MILSNNLISLISATIITLICMAFLYFVPGTNLLIFLVVGFSAFGSSFTIIYLCNEFLILSEVNKLFDKVAEFDYTLPKRKILKNNNPIKKLNLELEKYIEKNELEIKGLKELENFRKEFIANISHELKTPIFSVQGYINTILDDEEMDEKTKRNFLEKAALNIDSLEYLVSDILTLSKADSAKINLNVVTIDLLSLCHEVIEKLEDLAKLRKVTLILKHPKNIDFNIKADLESIFQIIKNLTENAIKYGKEEGEVVIRLKRFGSQVEVSVIDDGPGISPQDIDRIFERFYRVEKSRSRSTGGTGLGLAIVKNLLILNGSQIKVKSDLGKGSRFFFRLESVMG